jgi:1-pyrroline-5-carboxylate dehydrogenase
VGSKQNLTPWLNPRTIKENFSPVTDYRLGLMQES